MKNIIGVLFLLSGIFFMCFRGCNRLTAQKEYTQKIEYNWSLADRASTISQKSIFIDRFVKSLEDAKLNGVNSGLIYITPDNDFTQNLNALKSLQNRLHKISKMDENSFAYQTAIQQITEQEQGDATNMINCFDSCWFKQNYYTQWSWIVTISFIVLQILLIIVGIAVLTNDFD